MDSSGITHYTYHDDKYAINIVYRKYTLTLHLYSDIDYITKHLRRCYFIKQRSATEYQIYLYDRLFCTLTVTEDTKRVVRINSNNFYNASTIPTLIQAQFKHDYTCTLNKSSIDLPSNKTIFGETINTRVRFKKNNDKYFITSIALIKTCN